MPTVILKTRKKSLYDFNQLTHPAISHLAKFGLFRWPKTATFKNGQEYP
jgi:hypothetical protein